MPSFDIDKHTILLVLHGSRAYGTAIATSDRDLRGVAVPPRDHFFGFAHQFEQSECKEPDMVVYDIRKFFRMAADCNPNVIEILFADTVVTARPEAERLLAGRELFLSKKARHTFAGYAHAQLKRIRGHRAWLLDPPKAPPSREDFGLRADRKEFNDSVRGAMEELASEGHEFSAEVMRILDAEKRYAVALKQWQQYQRWQRERNPARAELEAKHGYDAKHAMHLVRLLRMCEEILDGRGVLVRRPDAEELREIRQGAWSYDRLIGWAEAQDAKCAALYETSSLPHSPDRETLDRLCVEVVGAALARMEASRVG